MKEGRTLTAQTAGGKVATTQMAKTIEVSKNEAGVHLGVNRSKETTLMKVAMAGRNQISEANLPKERLGLLRMKALVLPLEIFPKALPL